MHRAPHDARLVALHALQDAVEDQPAESFADAVCTAAAELVGVQAVSLCAYHRRGMSVPAGASSAQAVLAEQVQFTAGEGPCWQAFRSAGPVVVTGTGDRGGITVQDRWPLYSAALRRHTGLTGAAALPLALSSGLVVALVLYDHDELDDVVRGWSRPLTAALEEVLEEASGADRGGARWLDSSSTRRRALVWLAEEHVMDHVSGLDRDGAADLLRLHAALQGRVLDDVALDVHTGRLAPSSLLAAT